MSKHKRRRYKEYQTPPKELLASALHLLTGFPTDRRAAALQTMAELHKGFYTGLPLPEWVQMLADLAEREAAN